MELSARQLVTLLAVVAELSQRVGHMDLTDECTALIVEVVEGLGVEPKGGVADG